MLIWTMIMGCSRRHTVEVLKVKKIKRWVAIRLKYEF